PTFPDRILQIPTTSYSSFSSSPSSSFEFTFASSSKPSHTNNRDSPKFSRITPYHSRSAIYLTLNNRLRHHCDALSYKSIDLNSQCHHRELFRQSSLLR